MDQPNMVRSCGNWRSEPRRWHCTKEKTSQEEARRTSQVHTGVDTQCAPLDWQIEMVDLRYVCLKQWSIYVYNEFALLKYGEICLFKLWIFGKYCHFKNKNWLHFAILNCEAKLNLVKSSILCTEFRDLELVLSREACRLQWNEFTSSTNILVFRNRIMYCTLYFDPLHYNLYIRLSQIQSII